MVWGWFWQMQNGCLLHTGDPWHPVFPSIKAHIWRQQHGSLEAVITIYCVGSQIVGLKLIYPILVVRVYIPILCIPVIKGGDGMTISKDQGVEKKPVFASFWRGHFWSLGMMVFPHSFWSYFSNVVSTLLWNTPLITNRLQWDYFHSWPGGLTGVCSRGVL